jgi:hypothetical protein
MGLRANWQSERRKRAYTDRSTNIIDATGASVPKFIEYAAPAGAAYQTLYTVPAGKVFMVRKVYCSNDDPAGNLEITGMGLFRANTDMTFDVPVRLEAGATIRAWKVSGELYKVQGIEEDQSLQASRNV